MSPGRECKFTTRGHTILTEEILLDPTCFSRITNEELATLKLDKSDELIVKNYMANYRLQDHRAQPQSSRNYIRELFPIKSNITKRALKLYDLDNVNKLYFFATLDEIETLLADFPTIPTEDKQNLLSGITIARYALSHAFKPCKAGQ